MPNPYGRPRTQVTELRIRLPDDLMGRLYINIPSLFKPENPGIFKHGALSEYITTLVKRDLDRSIMAISMPSAAEVRNALK